VLIGQYKDLNLSESGFTRFKDFSRSFVFPGVQEGFAVLG
jgi:hypothetical protein